MRLWTVHPKYLDAKGLVALWREGLLAKAVLEGKTKGYRNHPQLVRFREHDQPLEALLAYLGFVLMESGERGYSFNAKKLAPGTNAVKPIEESSGQLAYEWQHLLRKLATRSPARYRDQSKLSVPEANPFFRVVKGEIKDWENVA